MTPAAAIATIATPIGALLALYGVLTVCLEVGHWLRNRIGGRA